MLSSRHALYIKGRFKVNGWEKLLNANSKKKVARVSILIYINRR